MYRGYLVNGLAFLFLVAVMLAFAAYLMDVVSLRPFSGLPFTFAQDFAEVLVLVAFLIPLIAAFGVLVVFIRAWR